MARTDGDLLQGTLDLIVLKALSWGPMHGFGLARWIQLTTEDTLQVEEGSLYPALQRMLRYAYETTIQVVMINTNGIHLARGPELVEFLASLRDRFEVYLQFDGLDDRVNRRLRGEDLLEIKLQALEALRRHNIRCTLVCTVDHNTNLDQVGAIVRFGLERPWVRGVKKPSPQAPT